MSEISIGYPHGPLNGPAARGIAGPAPGERVVARDGLSPVGTGSVPRFALFAEAGDGVDDVVERFDGLVDPLIRAPLHPGGMWLVRPDGYAACVVAAGDFAALADPLDSMVRAP